MRSNWRYASASTTLCRSSWFELEFARYPPILSRDRAHGIILGGDTRAGAYPMMSNWDDKGMNPDSNAAPTAAQRHHMIEVAAYYLSQHRGFGPGGAEADWLAAERAIDTMIADRRLERSMEWEASADVIRNALVLQLG